MHMSSKIGVQSVSIPTQPIQTHLNYEHTTLIKSTRLDSDTDRKDGTEMSLLLLQGYSSAEEDENAVAVDLSDYESNSEEEQHEHESTQNTASSHHHLPNPPNPSRLGSGDGDSALPSALEAFAEISGPPDFLKNSVGAPEETTEALGVLDRKWKKKRDRKELPAGAVLEAKPQAVGIRERVRSDHGSNPPVGSASTGVGKRVFTAANPGPEDAADLLRMCLACGVPKTYSHARGMVCPLCGDRPPAELKDQEKRKGSAIKDKEKSKRMRGQSSHATWKSETEMHLRQQFD